MLKPKRYAISDAYVDGYRMVSFFLSVAALSCITAVVNAHVINPLWLGGSIFFIIMYCAITIWFMRQIIDVNRIFIIYILSFLCLGSILSIVSMVTEVTLPTDLPVLSAGYYWFSMSPFVAGQLTSFDPGAVALSYAFIVGLASILLSEIVNIADSAALMQRVKKKFRMDEADLHSDMLLDKIGFWVSQDSKAWIIAPTALYIAVLLFVVGGAAFL